MGSKSKIKTNKFALTTTGIELAKTKKTLYPMTHTQAKPKSLS